VASRPTLGLLSLLPHQNVHPWRDWTEAFASS
jgi:hypothetical protein